MASPSAAGIELNGTKGIQVEKSGEIRSNGDSTPRQRILGSDPAVEDAPISLTPSLKSCTPMKWKSRRRCIGSCPSSPANLSAVKEALHVSTAPYTVVCRENEQRRVLEFCKQCIEREKAGSLYVCGCPATGKSVSVERLKESLVDWAQEKGFPPPDVLSIKCTSLTNTTEIFSKILSKNQMGKKTNSSTSPLKHLQNMYSEKQETLIIADELDYLISKDRAMLHDLFVLTALPFSRCILIGIANAIDLADRFFQDCNHRIVSLLL